MKHISYLVVVLFLSFVLTGQASAQEERFRFVVNRIRQIGEQISSLREAITRFIASQEAAQNTLVEKAEVSGLSGAGSVMMVTGETITSSGGGTVDSGVAWGLSAINQASVSVSEPLPNASIAPNLSNVFSVFSGFAETIATSTEDIFTQTDSEEGLVILPVSESTSTVLEVSSTSVAVEDEAFSGIATSSVILEDGDDGDKVDGDKKKDDGKDSKKYDDKKDKKKDDHDDVKKSEKKSKTASLLLLFSEAIKDFWGIFR